ncbi:MAG: ferrous iron transport protein B [Kiritimatiellia bacterium]
MSPVHTIALAGNPNCGKTTLFNRLTGGCRHVGNWPGVTVERAEGAYKRPAHDVWVTDLPGLYSLDAHTPDEKVTRDFVAEGGADLIVNIVDATNLERSLYLTTQLLVLGRPVVVVLNMMDLAGPLQIRIDTERLSLILGCPVLALAAQKDRKLDSLLEAVDMALISEQPPRPPAALPRTEEERYLFVRATARQVVNRGTRPQHRLSDTLDRYALSRAVGIPLFLAVMYLVFLVTVSGSKPVIGWIDTFCGRLFVELPRLVLERWGAPELLITVLADGAGAGIRAVSTFLPPIFGIFFCLAILENSGYMARGAFVMDRFLRKIGLPGRAFLPLLVGFGCNVPGIFATRTLKEKRERLITLLINPFMSCSARLPVYTLFAVAFFPRHGNQVVFALYLIGILMAILTGLLLQKTILRGEPSSFVMELPPYQVPDAGAVLRHVWENLKSFVVRGGKVIVLSVMALSLLNALGRGGESGQSWLERAGKAVTPVFEPLGVTRANWPATVGLVTGIIAKESVVGTLDALYGQMGAEVGDPHEPVAGATPHEEHGEAPYAQGGVRKGMLDAMRHHFGSPAAAFAYLLLVLLYVPCVATLAAMRREAGWGWTIFSLTYQTVLAWLTAMLFYQAATWRAHPESSLVFLLSGAGAVVLIVAGFRLAGRRAT